MLLATALFATALVQRNVFAPIPTYRPAFYPRALAGAHAEGALLKQAWIRGYRSIQSRWTLKGSFRNVVRELRRETMPEVVAKGISDEQLGARGVITCYQPLPDRMIEIFLTKGRSVRVETPTMRGELVQDQEEYVTAVLTERPLFVGPLPRTWLAAAKEMPDLSPRFPKVGISALQRPPDSWFRDITPGGVYQYWFQWFLPESPEKGVPRVLEQIGKTGAWKIGRRVGRASVRCEPKDKSTRFFWLSVEEGDQDPPDVPVHVTRVSVSWTDGRRVSH